jgi:ABC-2 type transport system ATP-binding protein
LDPRARVEVKALLKELRKMGKTILISSHILTELADCCTSIGIIERGQLLMHGPIGNVYKQIRRNRIVEVQFVSGEEAGMSILRSCDALRSIEMLAGRVVAELETDDEGLATLMEQLIAAGVRMKSFNDRDPTLEDVFMTVTKGLVV